jgi:PIN domain nuclease of toxin-antitoxin system
MRLLLDTHVAIWALASPELIPARIADLIADPDNDVYVSAASVWEIAIKFSLGKASAPPFSASDAAAYFAEAGFMSLPVTAAHAAAVEELPPLHADPFDRILLAQAISEPLRLVSHDAKLAAYGSMVLSW